MHHQSPQIHNGVILPYAAHTLSKIVAATRVGSSEDALWRIQHALVCIYIEFER